MEKSTDLVQVTDKLYYIKLIQVKSPQVGIGDVIDINITSH